MKKASYHRKTIIFSSFFIALAQALAITTGNYAFPFVIFAALIVIYFFYLNKAVLLFLILITRVLFDSIPTITYPKLAFGLSFMEYFTLALMIFMLIYLLVYKGLELDTISKSMLAVLMVMLLSTAYNGNIFGLIDVGSLWLYFIVSYLFFKYLSTDIPIQLTLKIICFVALYPFLNQLYSVILGTGKIHPLGYSRYAGTFYHTHNVADYLFFAIPATLYLAINEKRTRPKALYFALIVLYHIGIYLSAYRTTWIAVSVFWIFYIVFVSRRKLLSSLLMSLIVIFTWNVIGDVLSERLMPIKIISANPGPLFSSENYQYNKFLTGRIGIWKTSLDSYMNFPITEKILGAGVGKTFQITAINLNVPLSMHNEYLSFLVETGIVGLCLISAWIFIVIKTLFKSINIRKSYSLIVMSAFVACLVIGVAGMPFRNIKVINYMSLYLAMLGCPFFSSLEVDTFKG